MMGHEAGPQPICINTWHSKVFGSKGDRNGHQYCPLGHGCVAYKSIYSYQKLRRVPYQESYTERCWLFFTCEGFRTNYIAEFYTAFNTEEISCIGDQNKIEASQRELNSYNCSLAVCVDSLICDCGNAQGECQGLCSEKKAISGFLIMCPWGHKLVESNRKCVPRCTAYCTNGWCKRPFRDCTCFEGYWKNGSKCLPASRACIHGEYVSSTKCKCDSGWAGDSCDEPQWCVIAEVDGEGVAKGTSLKFGEMCQVSAIILRTSSNWTHNSEMVWKIFPACLPKCPEELYGKAVNSTQYLMDMIYHLIPIDSRCNKPEANVTDSSNQWSNIVNEFRSTTMSWYQYMTYQNDASTCVASVSRESNFLNNGTSIIAWNVYYLIAPNSQIFNVAMNFSGTREKSVT
ncbi:uncharacterized protein LOC124407933 [Diprion similis]|uniref:uncharacterized protein LOC124407933 n=1 Tax=Diprion similis TaxID=362088 RepID=UPI001EF75EBB|nr:uncharacterized protein LOC124407933 [Diprion similis]